MRFKLYFRLENENFPIQYRKSILSYIKFALAEYNEEYFKRFYNEKDNIIKPFTFSVFFKFPKIIEENILIESKEFELNISIENYETAIILYNAFNKQRYKKFSIYQNSWILQGIEMMMEKEIHDESIKIKFLSPLCVRKHQDKKDYYYSYVHEEFEDMLKINIKQQLQISDLPEEIVDNFKIAPIESKKVIIKFYEKKIECSTGIFNIQGDINLLKYLYQAGIGSKRSSGFGMFQII